MVHGLVVDVGKYSHIKQQVSIYTQSATLNEFKTFFFFNLVSLIFSSWFPQKTEAGQDD
jgi:hypothetical protein